MVRAEVGISMNLLNQIKSMARRESKFNELRNDPHTEIADALDEGFYTGETSLAQQLLADVGITWEVE